MSVQRKLGYVMGFVDATFLSPLYGAPKSEVAWLERCGMGMTDEQLVAVLEKWMAGNPERWHESMHVLALTALREACGR